MNIEEELNNDSSAVYEHELEREPYNFQIWWRYIQSKRDCDPEVRFTLYRRALKNLPGSYKLWNNYLQERKRLCNDVAITDNLYSEVNNDFDNALVYMHKMPKIWLSYCQFLIRQRKITITRRTFDRALQSLPITQHDMIWDLYIKFVKECGVWETAARVFKRYMLIEPSVVEEYIEYLLAIEKYDEASVQLCKIIDDDTYQSREGTSKQQLWMKLLNIIVKHPNQIHSVNVELVLRNGIKTFSEESGRWWCALAEYYNRMGNNEKARDVYEEAIQTVLSVRDFTMVYDAYVQSEMRLLEILIQNEDEEDEDDDDILTFAGEEVDEDLKDFNEDFDDVQIRQDRLEHIINQQPILLNNVRLRQNPHDVKEWLFRVKLFTDPSKGAVTEPDPIRAVTAFTEGVKTVDPMKAVGKFSLLWIEFAKLYEKYDDLENANNVFSKASQVAFKTVDELASVWSEWIEMFLRHDLLEEAYQTCLRSVTPPRRLTPEEESQINRPPQEKLYKSVRLWNLLVDMEESIGTIETTKAAYDRMFDLKIVTPQNVLNYASYLEEHNCFEEAFRVYEKGVSVFAFPYSREIWIQYVNKFVARYKGTKLERARDIFEKCLTEVNAENSKEFYLLYSRLEEEYGMVRHCMDILDRATTAVPAKDKYDLFLYYIKKVEDYYGATKTREVYEKAMESVPDDHVKDIALRFADLETKLGEIDRARAIFTYASQFCNPQVQITFWELWRDFEAHHGNTDTFKEMQRMKRSVQAEFMQKEVISADMIDSSLNSTSEGHPTIGGFKRGATEGSKSTLTEMESKAAKIANEHLETKEMTDFKRAVEEDPSLLDKAGRDPSVYMKNLDGVTTEKEFNSEV